MNVKPSGPAGPSSTPPSNRQSTMFEAAATPQPGMRPDTESMSPQDSIRAAASSAPPWPQKIGKFDVLSLLGSGAFGRVYHAFDPELRRDVAIKVPRPEALTPELTERFIREARAAATIRHANVCPVYDVGYDTNGVPFIVMGYVPGRTLADVIRQRGGPFPPRQAAGIVRRLALALEAAHQKGVIHRDLKPGNVLVDSDRHDVLITDFGLAKLVGDADAATTKVGDVLGTPAYMAPEQARGDVDAVGTPSDIYSLGVILYEMLAGQLPFRGTATEVLGQLLSVLPRPVLVLRPDLDPRLDAICRRAMAKKPLDRFAAAREMATALQDYLRSIESRSAMETTALPGVDLELVAFEVLPEGPVTPPPVPRTEAALPRPTVTPKPMKAIAAAPEPTPEITTAVVVRKPARRKVRRTSARRRQGNQPWILWSVVGLFVFAAVVYGSVRALRPTLKPDLTLATANPTAPVTPAAATATIKPTIPLNTPPTKLSSPLPTQTRPTTSETQSPPSPTSSPLETAPVPHGVGEPTPMPPMPEPQPMPMDPNGRPKGPPLDANGQPFPKGLNGMYPLIGQDGRPIPLGPDGRPAIQGPNGEWIPVGPDGRPLPKNGDMKGPKTGPGKGFPPKGGFGPMGQPPMG